MNVHKRSSAAFRNNVRYMKSMRGSLILAVLVVIVCAGAVWIAFLLVEQSQHALSVRRESRVSARRHAIHALQQAIAQLQETAGPDRVFVIPASFIHDPDATGAGWTGIVQNDQPDSTPLWLVSGENPDPTMPNDSVGWVSLLRAGVSDVVVPTIPIIRQDGTGPNTYGHMAWLTSDESLKADASIPDTQNTRYPPASPLRTTVSLTAKRRSGIETAIPALHAHPDRLESPESMDALRHVLLPEQLRLWDPIPPTEADWPETAMRSLTVRTLSVPVNPISGGLKINLTDPDFLDHDRITPRVRWWMTAGNYGVSSTNPATFQIRHSLDSGPPGVSRISADESPSEKEPLIALGPVLTEFKLYIGIFVGKSDRIHRIRYHMESELLNPYPWDLAFDSRTTTDGMEGRGYIIMVHGLPVIEISNTRTLPDGSSFEVGRFQANLSHFLPESEGFRYNTPSDQVIHSWQRFAVLSTPQTGWRRGIDAGTVYQILEPDKTDGLARTLADKSNNWIWTDSDDSTIPRTIAADDTISVRSHSPKDSVTIEFVPYAGEIEANDTPESYKARHGVMLRLKNIPFNPIQLELAGSQYCLETSGSYTRDNYRFAYYFKLNDDPDSLDRLSRLIHPQDPEIDFGNPEIRDLYSITSDPVLAQQEKSVFSSLDPLFWDTPGEENDHPPDRPTIILSELPVVDPISPSVFSSLILHGRPPFAIGNPDAGDWNDVFDRYFFSGLPTPGSTWEPDPTSWSDDQVSPGHLENPNFTPIAGSDGVYPSLERITGANGASALFIRGTFNINSMDPLAWAVFLHQALPPHPLVDLTIPGSTPSMPSVFSRLPFALPTLNDQLSDSDFFDEGTGMANPKAKWSQGIRVLNRPSANHPEHPGGDTLALAEAIVNELRIHGPFRTIRDFACSPVLQNAIDTLPNLNHGISRLAPAFLRPADILRSTAAHMTTRGDTFRIRAYGDTVHPRSGARMASALCEAWVQRYPDYHDPSDPPETAPADLTTLNARFGRRFRVVAFRWLQPPDP